MGQTHHDERGRIQGGVERFNQFVKRLKSDLLLVYDYDNVQIIVPNGNASFAQIEKILNSGKGQQQKRDELMQILYRQDAVDSILKNY